MNCEVFVSPWRAFWRGTRRYVDRFFIEAQNRFFVLRLWHLHLLKKSCLNFFFLNSRGQPVASNDKENNEVGVVSNVAIYSLKAKLGKLETETQTLKENVKKLEKEKSTLSLLNTEARYFVC